MQLPSPVGDLAGPDPEILEPILEAESEDSEPDLVKAPSTQDGLDSCH